MKTLIMILAFSALISCDNNDNKSEIMNRFNLENQIILSFKNSDGQNLLTPSTKNYYDTESIKLFYLIDEKPKEVTIKNGYNMGSVELTSERLLKVFTNFSSSNIVKETFEYDVVENIAYLKLSKTETDTIKTHSESQKNSFIVSKVWYNNQLVWEKETGGVIEITK